MRKRAEPESEPLDSGTSEPFGPEPPPAGARRNDNEAISAARQRFLERKKGS